MKKLNINVFIQELLEGVPSNIRSSIGPWTPVVFLFYYTIYDSEDDSSSVTAPLPQNLRILKISLVCWHKTFFCVQNFYRIVAQI